MHELIEILSESSPGERLSCGVGTADQLLSGGMEEGSLMEWGIPLGKGGRLLALAFVAAATQQEWPVLWVHGHPELNLYPPAFFCRGIRPEKISFAESTQPVQELRQVFSRALFPLWVVDSPQRLSQEEWTFLHHQTRLKRTRGFLIRNQWLSNQQGNVHARVRWNVWWNPLQEAFQIMVLKGPVGLGQTHTLNPEEAQWLNPTRTFV